MRQSFTGMGWTAVHEDSPPRILVRTGTKITGYIDVRTGMQISATKAQLEALGVSPKLLEDMEVDKP